MIKNSPLTGWGRIYAASGRGLYFLIRVFGINYFIKRQAKSLVIINNSKNQTFLVKNWLGDGRWCFAGGRLKLGESFEAAAIREIFEELGFQIAQKDLKKEFRLNRLAGYSYQAPATLKIAPNATEIVSSNWFSWAEVAKLPLTKQAFRALNCYRLKD